MQAIYIGHRKDKVDIVLGNFINTFPEREKMKILLFLKIFKQRMEQLLKM
jgi:hypothetical protein